MKTLKQMYFESISANGNLAFSAKSEDGKYIVIKNGSVFLFKLAKGTDIKPSVVGLSPSDVTKLVSAKTVKSFVSTINKVSKNVKFVENKDYVPSSGRKDTHERTQVKIVVNGKDVWITRAGNGFVGVMNSDFKSLSINDYIDRPDQPKLKDAKTDKEFLNVVKNKYSNAELVK